jgi:hypothetical protein
MLMLEMVDNLTFVKIRSKILATLIRLGIFVHGNKLIFSSISLLSNQRNNAIDKYGYVTLLPLKGMSF